MHSMKLNRTYLFIAVSSVALFIVLIIQVSWIVQTAKIKEELFNEKANMVLSKTAEALYSDTATFKNLQVCIDSNEVHTIDSLLNYYMKSYNIHIDYFFEVKQAPATAKNETGLLSKYYPEQPGSYKTCLKEEDSKTELELKLVFPEKEQFIIAEMRTPFITSVILILVVLVMFWQTILSLTKEKKISERTTDFLNNMTHEFKTPLTNISLAGKMMTKDSNIRQEDKVKHYSGIILEENEKLSRQVEQVLSMTALERGEVPLRKIELDFHQLIHDALKQISIQIENRQGNVTLLLEADRFMVTGDRTHLTNALCNLLDNAIKYSPERPELSIRTSNNGPDLIVVISDNGIGIEKEYQKEVFNKFYRVPTGDVHNVKGFGLGLAYIKTIVELHEGSITLQSEKGKGTAFTITLPYV